MFRRSSIILLLLTAVLGLAVACADTSTSLSPTPPPANTVASANPDGSLLKVTAPVPTSPSNNATLSQGVVSTVLQATASTAVNGGAPTLNYQFELFKGSSTTGSPIQTMAGTVSGSTVSTTAASLDLLTQYSWHVRAELNGAASPWSPGQVFTTGGQARRDASAFGGQVPRNLAIADLQSQLGPVTAAHPAEVQASCNNGRNALDFPTVLLQALRKIDNRWGFNCRRGNCADPSNDVVVYHWGVGSSEQSTKVYIFDVIGGLDAVAGCKTQIVDVTDSTFGAGTVGKFSLLGRFPPNNPDF